MGGSISKLFTGLIWGKKDIRILILGLVSFGSIQYGLGLTIKRTMLERLHYSTGSRWVRLSPRYLPSDSTSSMAPLQKSNHITNGIRTVKYGQLTFDVWDLGGQTSIRPYWRSYYANTGAVVFVVDSTDIERLEIAADELKSMLNEDELRDAALLVFANKQDQVSRRWSGPS